MPGWSEHYDDEQYAALLLAGLLRRGSYRPEPGWAKFALQVLAATLLMFAFLLWADGLEWVEVSSKLWRIGQFVAVVAGAGVLYFGALALGGFKLRQLLRR